jgi:hypothetical protein
MAANGFHTQQELDEIAKRGEDLYARLVKPKLRPEDDGKFVAVDINTGEFEIDEDDCAAMMRLTDRLPAAQIWMERAGSPTAYQILTTR